MSNTKISDFLYDIKLLFATSDWFIFAINAISYSKDFILRLDWF